MNLKFLFVATAISLFAHSDAFASKYDPSDCKQSLETAKTFAAYFQKDQSQVIYDTNGLMQKTVDEALETVRKLKASHCSQSVAPFLAYVNVMSLCTQVAVELTSLDSLSFTSKALQDEFYQFLRDIVDSYSSKDESKGFVCHIDEKTLSKNRHGR